MSYSYLVRDAEGTYAEEYVTADRDHVYVTYFGLLYHGEELTDDLVAEHEIASPRHLGLTRDGVYTDNDNDNTEWVRV